MLEQILKPYGDDLIRDNIMKQAATPAEFPRRAVAAGEPHQHGGHR
jgi:hypothetical protein